MGTVSLEGNLGLSPDDLWNHMNSFGEVSGFLDVITESSLVDGDPGHRTCLLADGTVLDESLMTQDDDAKTLTYTINSGLPFTRHSSTMSVRDAGGGRSVFRWVTDYTAASDGVPEGFGDMFGGMLAAEVTKLEQRWP